MSETSEKIGDIPANKPDKPVYCPRCGQGILIEHDVTKLHGNILDVVSDDALLFGVAWRCIKCEVIYLDIPEIISIWGRE